MTISADSQIPVKTDTPAGQFNSWLDYLSAGHGAVLFQHREQAVHGAWHTHRQMGSRRQTFDPLSVVVEVHIPGGGQRRTFAVIIGRHSAISHVYDHEATPTQIARGRVGNGQCKANGYSGVYRVATFSHDVGTHL